MFLESLSVSDFRNLEEDTIFFDKNVNIISGENAQGKTNLLEAIYLCSTGRSQRTNIDRELIEFSKTEAHLKINIDNDGFKDRIDIHLRKEPKKGKGIAVNSIPIRNFSQMYGIIYAVIFSPEDLDIVKEGPAVARKFIDAEICQISSVYYDNLKKYCKVLKQRNMLLKDISNTPKLEDTLFIWDKKLEEYGKYIIKARRRFIEKISEISYCIHSEISGGKENLKIIYKPSVNEDEFTDGLNKTRERDIILKSTSLGPHKDNIVFHINDKDARKFGSQGQQRCIALSLKISEVEFIKEYTGKRPLLLLDDVLSELDGKRQVYLVDRIRDGQTIITCAGVEDSLKRIKNAKLFNVENGRVSFYL